MPCPNMDRIAGPPAVGLGPRSTRFFSTGTLATHQCFFSSTFAVIFFNRDTCPPPPYGVKFRLPREIFFLPPSWRKATHISSFMFNCQLSTKPECSGVALFESSLTLPASAKASHVSTSSSTGPGGKVACRREATSTSGFHSWYNHTSSSAAMRPRIGHSTVVGQKLGSP